MMKLVKAVTCLSGVAAAAVAPLAAVDDSADVARKPTSAESAVMGRRILGLQKLVTISTVYPNKTENGLVDVPDDEPAGVPIGLMDYVADCEDRGDPTLLAVEVGTSFKNARAGSNVTLSMRWMPPYPPDKPASLYSRLAAYVPFLRSESAYKTVADTPDVVPYSAAALPRFAMIGYLETIDADDAEARRLAACYTDKHPDAKNWLPGNEIHTSEWARLVVNKVYWIGGFGNRAYIGWIPMDQWQSVTREQWESVRLPGEEKHWKEGSANEL